MVRIDYYLKGCMVEQKRKNNITEGANFLDIPGQVKGGSGLFDNW